MLQLCLQIFQSEISLGRRYAFIVSSDGLLGESDAYTLRSVIST